MATHFPYPYPPAFERFGPVSHEDDLPNWDQLFRAPLDREKLWNRYRNAALSLEAQLVDFVAALDPARNVIAVTGDHGESFGDDGALVHGSRASDAQTRVPLLIVGPGIEPRTTVGPTSHMDVLPTLLHAATGVADPVQGVDGRDLLAASPPREDVFVAPYKLTQPYDLLWIRGDRRLLFRVRTDRPLLDAFAFVDDSGFPLLAPDPSVLEDAARLGTAIHSGVARLGGDEAAPVGANAR
jgi:phosphoglycerol transferase MdoB-like AlkP superfamily enzyme